MYKLQRLERSSRIPLCEFRVGRLVFHLIPAHLREFSESGCYITAVSLRARFDFKPIRDCLMRLFCTVIPGRIYSCRQLESNMIHRVKEIDAVDSYMVGPHYFETIGDEPIIPSIHVFPGWHFERQMVENPMRRMVNKRHLRNPRS